MKIDLGTLRKFKSLSLLSDDEVLSMSQAMSPLSAPAGGLLHKQGTKERNFFLLRSGIVEIRTRLPDGESLLLSTIEEGASFGQGALVTGAGQSLSFKAKTAVQLLVLPGHLHAWSLEQGEQWAIKLQKAVCFGVVKSMRQVLEHLKSLASSEKDSISEKNQKSANSSNEELRELLGKTEISFFELEKEDDT